MQFRLPEPGDHHIRAEDIRAIAAEVLRQRNFTADREGDYLESGQFGVHLSSRRPPPAFWARLTSEIGGGAYHWIEQWRTDINVFEDVQYGRTSADELNPAYEANRATGLPTDASAGLGLYVWLERGWGRPVTGGVEQEWIFRQGGGVGTQFFPAQIKAGGNCTQGTFFWDEVQPASGGTWELKPGGRSSDANGVAYHLNKQNFPSGGPLVAAGTIVWMTAGYTGEWVFDCPAGPTGTTEVVGRWRCVGGVPEVLPYYIEWWNGQAKRLPSHLTNVGPCEPWTPPPA